MTRSVHFQATDEQPQQTEQPRTSPSENQAQQGTPPDKQRSSATQQQTPPTQQRNSASQQQTPTEQRTPSVEQRIPGGQQQQEDGQRDPDSRQQQQQQQQQGQPDGKEQPVWRVRVKLLDALNRADRRRVVDQWWQDWREGKLPAVYYRTMPRYPYLQEMKDKLLNTHKQPDGPAAAEEPRTMETVELGEPCISVVKMTPERCLPPPCSTRTAAVKNPKTACFRILSLVYAKLLVVVCVAFLISEIITDNVPLYFYEGFFTYLYGISILFLLYVFIYLLHESTSKVGKKKKEGTGCCGKKKGSPSDVNLNEGAGGSPEKLTKEAHARPYKTKTSDNEHSHGGFFLRIGAIAFGLGTMVYNGFELGSFFEIPEDSDCWQILMAVNPCLQAAFTFMQMYFIFMNSRLNIHKFKVVARFGLMHIVATNICVWLRTLVRESLRVFTDYNEAMGKQQTEDFLILANRLETGSNYSYYNCNRLNIMGSIVSDASPYLFPLIIEYSLIGATVLYIMWKNIGRCPRYLEEDDIPDHVSITSRKAHTKVDCIGSSKGLFCGLLVLVAAIICLVLFFVLIGKEDQHMLAIFLADTSHAGILLLMLLATFVGFARNRKLKFVYEKPDDLDAILLRVSGFGLFLYSVFCVIAAALSSLPDVPNLLVLITASLVILQVMIQLLYISDVSKRCVYKSEHDLTKPGRQVVTFLLLCNLALWIVYTFEIDKVQANPVQLRFYGSLNWAVILRVTLPLAIFHRFHSAVVLAEVWKSSYKARAD